MKILYNDTFGGFDFSDAFFDEYKTRTGKELNLSTELYHTGPNCIRCNPVAIAIFEEKGAQWSSGPSAELAIYEVPDVFANYWEIDEYDGNETVRVNVTEALADILDTYMETKDHAVLEQQYKTVKEACANLANNKRYGLRSADLEPTSNAVPPQLTIYDEEV
jgi:hypothetical protein